MRAIKYVRCIKSHAYATSGKYYKFLGATATCDYFNIIDSCGDRDAYPSDSFEEPREVDARVGDYITPREMKYSFYSISGNNIYKAHNIKIKEDVGPCFSIRSDDNAWEDVPAAHFSVVKSPYFGVGEIALCQFSNKYGSTSEVDLTRGKTYEVLETRTSDSDVLEVKVENDKGSKYWYSAVRFIKGKTLPTTKTSAEAHKETIDMKTTTTTKGANKLMDRLGAFGQVDNVAMTMTGKLAFLGEDGNYYSYENGVLVNNEDMVIDAIPGFAMPVSRASIKTGDLIIQKDGTYLFADVKGDWINEKGEIVSTVETKHVMFGNNFDFVSKIMDFGGLAGNGTTTDGANMFANPIMMAMMMNKNGDSDDMMKAMVMSQVMNGQAKSDNPMANMMLPMMFMGKDSSGKGNDWMRNMFMMQMFQNQQKEAK